MVETGQVGEGKPASDSSKPAPAEEKKETPSPAPAPQPKAEPKAEPKEEGKGSSKLVEELAKEVKELRASLAREQEERMKLLEQKRRPYRVFKPGFKVKGRKS